MKQDQYKIMEKSIKRIRHWQNWYNFFSNMNPSMNKHFPQVVKEDKEFRNWLNQDKTE